MLEREAALPGEHFMLLWRTYCLHSQRASGSFFLALLPLRMKIICSFKVSGTTNLVAQHHILNYTAVKTSQLTCKYIYLIYSESSIYNRVCTKKIHMREYFPTRILYNYSTTKLTWLISNTSHAPHQIQHTGYRTKMMLVRQWIWRLKFSGNVMPCHAVLSVRIYQTAGRHIPEDQIFICNRLLVTPNLELM